MEIFSCAPVYLNYLGDDIEGGVEEGGRIDTVILSAKQFSELQAGKNMETLTQRKAQFEQSHGLWCDDIRVW